MEISEAAKDAEIERLMAENEKLKEIERKRWESATKCFGENVKPKAQTGEENKIGECIGTLPDDGKTDAEVRKEFNDHNEAQTGEEE